MPSPLVLRRSADRAPGAAQPSAPAEVGVGADPRGPAARGPAVAARRLGGGLLLGGGAIAAGLAMLAARQAVPAGAGGPAGRAAAGTEACCLPDGSCAEVPAGSPVCFELLGGVLLGPGTQCLPGTCGGACCFADDGTCLEDLGFGECLELGGVFAGFGSDCEPVPCGTPTGACCRPDGTCVPDVSEGLCVLSLGGTWPGAGSACGDVACCPGDVRPDGTIDLEDLVTVLSDWGACSPAEPCPADLDGDGVVGTADLLVVLAAFGCG